MEGRSAAEPEVIQAMAAAPASGVTIACREPPIRRVRFHGAADEGVRSLIPWLR